VNRGGRIGRRLLLLLPFGVTGCGFHPVYGGSAGGASGPAQAGLAEVSIGIIPERFGQLLRQALQARFTRGGTGVASRYDLTVAYGLSGEPLAIQQDSSITRVRLVSTATWTLTAQDPQRRTLANGTARSVDAYNAIDNQLFTADLDNEATQRRMSEALAEEITLQLAVWFGKQAKA